MVSGDGNPWEFVPAICALVSLGHCCWLVFVFMRRMHPKHRSGLLMRQLWYIAVADMVSAVFSIVTFVVDRVPYQTTQSGCAASQYTIWGLFLLSIDMSILVQAHFTAGLLMSLRHWRRGLARLSRILPALILPALLITGLDLWETNAAFEFDPRHGCVWVTRDHVRQRSAPYTSAVALAVILVNAAVYAMLLLEGCACGCCAPSVVLPGSIGARVLLQARRYMLVTLCTWLPYWLVTLCGHTPALTWASSPAQALSTAGVTLNGAMNVWSFALHNRHIKRAMARSALSSCADPKVGREMPVTASGESRHVGFDPNFQICQLSHHQTTDTANSTPLTISLGGSGCDDSQRGAGVDMLSAGGEDPLGFFFVELNGSDHHMPDHSA